MSGASRQVRAVVRDDGGPTRTFLSIYFDRTDLDVLPPNDKGELQLDLNGEVLVGVISLLTSHPPYLLTWLRGRNGQRRCTDCFLERGWNNGAELLFQVVAPGRLFRFVKTLSYGAPLPKGSTRARPRTRNGRTNPAPQSHSVGAALNRETVERYADLYWSKILPSEKRQEEEFERRFTSARGQGFLPRELFIEVGVWKARERNRHWFEQNRPKAVRRQTELAFQAATRGQAISHLKRLSGVGMRTAVAMLHWMRPKEFPMIDERVVRALGWETPSNWESLEYYEMFAKAVLELADRLGVDLRKLDRAMWTIDKCGD